MGAYLIIKLTTNIITRADGSFISYYTIAYTEDKLSRDLGHALSDTDAFLYESAVRTLQCLILTRLDISFAINKICQSNLDSLMFTVGL